MTDKDKVAPADEDVEEVKAPRMSRDRDPNTGELVPLSGRDLGGSDDSEPLPDDDEDEDDEDEDDEDDEPKKKPAAKKK